MKEIIKRFEKTKIYISNYGKAFRVEGDSLVEAPTSRAGKKLAISVGSGVAGRMNIDSLVWRTFNGKPEGRNKLHVTHKDGNPDNNRLDNLDMPQIRKKETVTISATKYEEMLRKIESYEAKQLTIPVDDIRTY